MPGLSQRTLLVSALALALSAVGVGCSADSSNDAPIIDYVDSPKNVTAEDGSYRLPMTIGFHDNDQEVVTRVHYRALGGIEGIVDLERPNPAHQSAEVTLVIPALAADAGEQRELEITIIDGRGAESRPQAQTITFE